MTDEFVICPFNRSHIISRLRIQYHLVKCKKNYPHTKKLVCPYDATEYIDPIDYIAHLCQCKKKRCLDVTEEFRQKQYEFIQHGDVSNQTFFAPGVEVTDEWDVLSSDENEDMLTHDELKVIELKNQTSKALKRACTLTPVVPHSFGRGITSDLYQNYTNNLHQTPENNVFTQSVAYFPLGNIKSHCSDADEKTFDSNTEDEAICSSSEKEIDDKEIYEDAEEEKTEEEKQKPSDNIKINNIDLVTCDSLKYQSMGRGSARFRMTMGRGASMARGACPKDLQNPSVASSQTRTLDNILKEVILVKMMENSSPLKCNNSTPLNSCKKPDCETNSHSSIHSCVNTDSGAAIPNHLLVISQSSKVNSTKTAVNRYGILSEETNCDLSSVSSSSSNQLSVKTFPPTSYALTDEAIGFSKSLRKGIKNNSSNVTVRDVTDKFQPTLLKDKHNAISEKESDDLVKERENTKKCNKDIFPVPCVGRGKFMANHS